MKRLFSIPRREVSPSRKFWVLLLGGFVGYYIGFHLVFKDYQFIKYTPPELDENGKVKKIPLRVEFKEMTPLELTPELKLRKELREVLLKKEQLEKTA